METIVEKDSPVMALTLVGVMLLLFIGGVFGLAYLGGVFTGKKEVIENDKRIVKQQLLDSPAPSAPATARP